MIGLNSNSCLFSLKATNHRRSFIEMIIKYFIHFKFTNRAQIYIAMPRFRLIVYQKKLKQALWLLCEKKTAEAIYNFNLDLKYCLSLTIVLNRSKHIRLYTIDFCLWFIHRQTIQDKKKFSFIIRFHFCPLSLNIF